MPCPYWWSEDRSHGVTLWSKSGEWNALVTLRKSLPLHIKISSSFNSLLVYLLCVCISYLHLVYLRQIFQIHWQTWHLIIFQVDSYPFQQETLTFQFLTLLTCRSLLVFTCFFCSIHHSWRAPCNINCIAILLRDIWKGSMVNIFRASKKALPLSIPNPRFYWGINQRWYGKGNLFLAPSKSVFRAKIPCFVGSEMSTTLSSTGSGQRHNPFPIQTRRVLKRFLLVQKTEGDFICIHSFLVLEFESRTFSLPMKHGWCWPVQKW